MSEILKNDTRGCKLSLGRPSFHHLTHTAEGHSDDDHSPADGKKAIVSFCQKLLRSTSLEVHILQYFPVYLIFWVLLKVCEVSKKYNYSVSNGNETDAFWEVNGLRWRKFRADARLSRIITRGQPLECVSHQPMEAGSIAFGSQGLWSEVFSVISAIWAQWYTDKAPLQN